MSLIEHRYGAKRLLSMMSLNERDSSLSKPSMKEIFTLDQVERRRMTSY